MTRIMKHRKMLGWGPANTTPELESLSMKEWLSSSNFGIDFVRRTLQPSALGADRDSDSASPQRWMGTGKMFYISCGRKFKSLLGEVVSKKTIGKGLVILRHMWPLIILVLVVCTIRLTIRRLYSRRRWLELRIASVIERAQAELVLHTEARVRYSTEYTHLTYDKINRLFELGCISIGRDESTSKDVTLECCLFTKTDWDRLEEDNRLALQDNRKPFPGKWHAVWNQPPRIEAGCWDIQNKTQKISYDVVNLGRNSQRNKILYNSASDFGLCSGWIKFFYDVHDDVPNFLRNWEHVYPRIARCIGIWLPNHALMLPPGDLIPMLVPCPIKYRTTYLKLHRVKVISDKLTATMRSDGNWNETVFLTSYERLVSGNNQTSMGHRLSDPAMNDYLPLVRERVRGLRANGGTSD